MAARFLDKVVIVTGSSAGIGREAAREFAREGACVVIHGQNEERLNKTEEALLQETDESKILKVIGSLEDEETPKRLIDATVERFQKIDVLVNNAGALKKPEIPPEEESSLDNLDYLFKVNLRSVVALIQLAQPHLEATRGNVINISSVSAIRPVPGVLYYGALKAALDHLTRTYAPLLAPKGIRVNSILPGLIHTLITRRNHLGSFDKFAHRVCPLDRVGHPSEIATVIKFLASDEASYVTGSNWLADGGFATTTPALEF